MFNFFKQMINQGDFELTNMLERIAAVYADGRMTTEEFDELKALAFEKADPVQSLAPLEDRFDIILQKLDALEARIAALEGTEPAEPGDEPAGETYPEWTQPLGAHDAYQTGDRVTFNGEVYESLINANVWSPAAYPAGWQKIEVTTEPEPEEEGEE